MNTIEMTLENIKSFIPIATKNNTLPSLIDILVQWAEQANTEISKLQVELNNYKKASAFCKEHTPKGGSVGYCVICSGYKLSKALSNISYECEESNEYKVSSYDLHCDEDAVVEQVRRKINK